MGVLDDAINAESPAERGHQGSTWQVWLCGGLLCVMCLAAYRSCFPAPLIFDDRDHLLARKSFRSVWPGIRERRPVGHFTLAVNYALGGLDPRGYRVFNVAVHLLAGLTLFGLVRRTLLLPSLRARYGAASLWLAFGVAAVWMLHPLQTQSVTYLIQRYESLMGLFYLACLYCVIRGSQKQASKKAVEKGTGTDRPDRSQSPFSLWYVAAVAACWLGMGTKEVMATAPLVVLLFDRCFLADSWKSVFRRRWPLYLGFLPAMIWMAFQLTPTFRPVLSAFDSATAGGTSVGAGTTGSNASIGFTMEGLSSWAYLRSQPGVILHYLRLAFWPDKLCLDYMWPVAKDWYRIYLPGAVILALLGISLISLRFRPKLGFLGLAFFLILAPTSSFVPIADLAFEHRMYLPLACVAALVTFSVYEAIMHLSRDQKSQRIAFVFVLGTVCLALGLRTSQRNRDYRDPVQLWSDVIAMAPHNYRAYNNLGLSLEDVGKDDAALDCYRQSLELQPKYVPAMCNLGRQLNAQGKVAEAIEQYRLALRFSPSNAVAHNNLALSLAATDNVREANIHFQRAVQLVPYNAEFHNNFGSFCAGNRDFRAAIVHFRNAITADPGYVLAHYNLGVSYYEIGEPSRAVASLERTLELKPDFFEAKKLLAWILATTPVDLLRDGAEALRLAKSAQQQVRGNDLICLDTLAAAYAETGRFDEAILTARRAERLARAAANESMAEEIAARVMLYEAGQPFRESRSAAKEG